MAVPPEVVDAACEAFVRYRIGEDFLRGMTVFEQEEMIVPRKAEWRPAVELILAAAEEKLSAKIWQPIATAPKDGRWVLLGWFEFPGQKSVEAAFWNRIKDTWCGAYAVFNTKGYPVPTHWQPIPEPPE